MSRVTEARMYLRVQYTRETNELFEDDIALYADWLEKKLADKNCSCSEEEKTGETTAWVCNLCGKITKLGY